MIPVPQESPYQALVLQTARARRDHNLSAIDEFGGDGPDPVCQLSILVDLLDAAPWKPAGFEVQHSLDRQIASISR